MIKDNCKMVAEWATDWWPIIGGCALLYAFSSGLFFFLVFCFITGWLYEKIGDGNNPMHYRPPDVHYGPPGDGSFVMWDSGENPMHYGGKNPMPYGGTYRPHYHTGFDGGCDGGGGGC